jgi:ubiquinone/menaquinone biosynthesis C-methylase UbiE
MILNNALETSREYVKKAAKQGDAAVDATAGRGRDTLFLSKPVGSEGRVYAFDIQRQAIETTKNLSMNRVLQMCF